LASNQTWRELFTKHVGEPAGVTETCQYAYKWPSPDFISDNINTGSMLFCSMTDYYKILRAYFNGRIVSAAHQASIEGASTMTQGAKLPDYMTTMAATYNSTVPVQYGLGCWRVCYEADCSGPRLVKSQGLDGVYPFISKF
jgi:hypothetical protein